MKAAVHAGALVCLATVSTGVHASRCVEFHAALAIESSARAAALEAKPENYADATEVERAIYTALTDTQIRLYDETQTAAKRVEEEITDVQVQRAIAALLELDAQHAVTYRAYDDLFSRRVLGSDEAYAVLEFLHVIGAAILDAYHTLLVASCANAYNGG